jgi:hypothetical protein
MTFETGDKACCFSENFPVDIPFSVDHGNSLLMPDHMCLPSQASLYRLLKNMVSKNCSTLITAWNVSSNDNHFPILPLNLSQKSRKRK